MNVVYIGGFAACQISHIFEGHVHALDLLDLLLSCLTAIKLHFIICARKICTGHLARPVNHCLKSNRSCKTRANLNEYNIM